MMYIEKTIPIFYACDNNFIKYTIVSIKSLIENSSKDLNYKIYILISNVSEETKIRAQELLSQNVSIEFVDMEKQIEKISKNLPIRDYYSKTTYFRLYIADLFPEYDKAIYIDSDTVVLGDISKLYHHDLKENYVGACNEQVMLQTEVFGNYVENVLGIDRNNYFNAGILLLNTKLFRENKILKNFIDLLNKYTFAVTQDQDYLNVLCKDSVLFLDQGWNTEVYGNISVEESDIKIIHYIMVSKPWHYSDCRLKEYFWKYAEKTSFYNEILDDLFTYTDDQRKTDKEGCDKLVMLAQKEALRIDTYKNLTSNKNPYRVKVLEKIRQYEIEERFDIDVEDDPETIILRPDKVDYLNEKLSSKIFTKIANNAATKFYEKRISNGELIIENIVGLENYKAVQGGAIITCNHFNPNDNYAIWRAIKKEFPRKRRLYKIIREGNYTNFKGLYGFFFRHCNTLPLSSDIKTMQKFLKSVSILLNRGEKILIYPEQAMWWNYKKPRPMKEGAFKIASMNNVPIIPSFITMRDTDKLDSDGFNVQAYTIHFLPAIYPEQNVSTKENTINLRNLNYEMWKNLYEEVYKIPLSYGA